jgi:acetyl-CoA carboxylase / biotin carboxylase 1
MGVMEELELNSHNTTIKYEHAHMYLYIIRKQKVDDLVPNSK